MGRSAGRHRALVRRPRPGPRRPRFLLRPAPTPDPPEEGPGSTMTHSEAARLGARAARRARAPRGDSKHSLIRLRPRPTSTRAKPTELPFEPPTGEAPHVRGEHHA